MESYSEAITSAIVSSAAHAFTFPAFLIYFLTGKDLYEPVDFRGDVIDNEYKMNLIEGVVFHYKGKNELPNLTSMFL